MQSRGKVLLRVQPSLRESRARGTGDKSTPGFQSDAQKDHKYTYLIRPLGHIPFSL